MYGLVNSKFSRTYNPSGRQNALSDIKRLLTSRDVDAQNKACGYLIEVLSRYKENSDERARVVEYLLNNDIIVFLCEATSNLDFSLFRSILTCTRLLWRGRRFFEEEHAAHAMSAVLRALAHYAAINSNAAIDVCLHFLCDLLNGISLHESASPLSHQSAYSVEQLLACLNALTQCFNKNPNSILCSALVIHALISYQPPNLVIRACTATALVQVLNPWLELLVGALNHTVLVDDNGMLGMLLVVTSQIGMNVLRLEKLLGQANQRTDFIQSILTDDQETNTLKESASEMKTCTLRMASELIVFVKDYQDQISTEEYSLFLKFLLNFLHYNTNSYILSEFCDVLFAKGYLTMLPKCHIRRNDSTVRKLSTLILGEILIGLAKKYLVNETEDNEMCAKQIHYGLVELQYGMERPQNIGEQLQKSQPYSLLIYIYFYCQSSDNPEEATAPLLPFLVEYVLCLPKSIKPPLYIIKALWLVFAMSTISNGSLQSLEERVYLEKATDRLISLLHPEPYILYTHNPAILLWVFSSHRIPHYVRSQVLSQWLKTEDTLPDDLAKEFEVWELLLNILIKCTENIIIHNCMEMLKLCLAEAEYESKQVFATTIWSKLPEVLSKALIDYNFEIGTNICYLMDIATNLLPTELDQTICLKTAVVLTVLFSKSNLEATYESIETKNHYEYVCLKLSLVLLHLAHDKNDNKVLLTYTNREGFLRGVLLATDHVDDRVACAALQLLSYVVRYFARNNYQAKTILQVQTELVIKSLRKDSTSERGVLLLNFIYRILDSGVNTPFAFSDDVKFIPSESQQCVALRALMFRIQLTLCCKDTENQSAAGWKTLSSIFKHAVVYKKDSKLVAILASQPWTHTLIRFQLSQNVTKEFLAFAHDWLKLLEIIIRRSQEGRKRYMSKYNPVTKTLILIKNNLEVEDESKELKQEIIQIIDNIAEESSIKLK
ncbi:unnamed protein product [Parnassius mnemosyne]|uniref:Uncharacterized protein n=1 Tax=Parnassius mnemosyne TaxID=213953 RepID=A0AAV1KRP1_9NEOP